MWDLLFKPGAYFVEAGRRREEERRGREEGGTLLPGFALCFLRQCALKADARCLIELPFGGNKLCLSRSVR
uniref:Uncharacterized protein n=1 Tax=Knipowitschia caucasica TaxID=637954 RepID=A0AAV2JX24_KNICA